MEDSFYAVIKLKTGEELVSEVCYAEDENLLILSDPMVVEPMQQKKGRQNVEGFILRDWIYASYDDFFFLSMNDILTISELDDNIKLFYTQTVQNKHSTLQQQQNLDFGRYDNNNTSRQNLNDLTEKGYLGSVQQTKQLLEELYKKS